MPKPDYCRYLSFATDPVLSFFIWKYNFFTQIDSLVPKYDDIFENRITFG